MTKATAQMGGLTREDVDVVIGKAINACVVDCKPDTCHCELVRDLAYAAIESDPITVGDVAEAIVEDRQRQSLSLESVRSEGFKEGLEEAARICETEYRKWSGEPTDLGSRYAAAIRSLSPARVAEGRSSDPEFEHEPPETQGTWQERCAALYQVVGCMANMFGIFETSDDVSDALDVAAGRGDVEHLLPWPKADLRTLVKAPESPAKEQDALIWVNDRLVHVQKNATGAHIAASVGLDFYNRALYQESSDPHGFDLPIGVNEPIVLEDGYCFYQIPVGYPPYPDDDELRKNAQPFSPKIIPPYDKTDDDGPAKEQPGEQSDVANMEDEKVSSKLR